MDDASRIERLEEQLQIDPIDPSPDLNQPSVGRGPRQALPRIRVDVFVEDAEDRDAVHQMATDRRAERATVEVFDGGFEAAFELYESREAADLVVVEHLGSPETLPGLVDRLADFCHQNTRVVVIGDKNDVDLYRRLTQCGVSDYLVRPISPVHLLETLLGVLENDDLSEGPLGSIIAVQGARGGAGASTIAHNVADALASHFGRSALVIDAYDGFGSASMQFDAETNFTLADAFKEGASLTPQLLESRVFWRDKRLGLVAAPVRSEPLAGAADTQFEHVLSLARKITRHVVVDLPTRPNAWSMDAFKMADEICVVGTDDLPTLRNANMIFSLLGRLRPNDAPGRFILNRVAGKTELVPGQQFKNILGVEITMKVPFVDIASKAEHNGKMLREEAPRAPAVQCINQLAGLLGDVENAGVSPKKRSLVSRLLGRGS